MLKEKTVKELKEIAKFKGVKLPAKANKEDIIKAIEEYDQVDLIELDFLGTEDDDPEQEVMMVDGVNVMEEMPLAYSGEFRDYEQADMELGEMEEPEDPEVPEQDRKYIELHVDQLVPFEGNLFNALNPQKFNELRDSIENNGVLMPLIVRLADNGKYEILAGANRHQACIKLGIDYVPVQIVDVDDEKAREIMIDTNVAQRMELSPMELAKAYQAKKEIIGNRQGARSDIDTSKSMQGSTRDLIAQEYGKSGMTIERYIRLNNLTPEFAELVDCEEIPVKVGTELALINEATQNNIMEVVRDDISKLKAGKVTAIKKILKEEQKTNPEAFIGQNKIREIMAEEKPKKEKFSVDVPEDLEAHVKLFLVEASEDPYILFELIREHGDSEQPMF